MRRTMTEAERSKFLAVCDGDSRALPILHQFYKIRWREVALDWLLMNQITGPKFVDWYRFECNGSWLQAASKIKNSCINEPRIYAKTDLLSLFDFKKIQS